MNFDCESFLKAVESINKLHEVLKIPSNIDHLDNRDIDVSDIRQKTVSDMCKENNDKIALKWKLLDEEIFNKGSNTYDTDASTDLPGLHVRLPVGMNSLEFLKEIDINSMRLHSTKGISDDMKVDYKNRLYDLLSQVKTLSETNNDIMYMKHSNNSLYSMEIRRQIDEKKSFHWNNIKANAAILNNNRSAGITLNQYPPSFNNPSSSSNSISSSSSGSKARISNQEVNNINITSNIGISECVDESTVVVTFSFHEPTASELRTMEVATLDSNTLIDVEKQIQCPQNHEHVYTEAKDKSFSFFFIEGCFYVNCSNAEQESCVDYIKRWIEEDDDDDNDHYDDDNDYYDDNNKNNEDPEKEEVLKGTRSTPEVAPTIEMGIHSQVNISKSKSKIKTKSKIATVFEAQTTKVEVKETAKTKNKTAAKRGKVVKTLRSNKKGKTTINKKLSNRRRTLGLVTADPILIKRMDSTTIGSIHFRVAIRYLYCHGIGAQCNHWFYLVEAHMYHECLDNYNLENIIQLEQLDEHERRQKRSDFPIVLYRAKTSVRRCSICDATSAKYVVFHDRLSGNDASFQCLHCFHMLHYTATGQLIYNDFIYFDYEHEF